jgi:hypothetical protein
MITSEMGPRYLVGQRHHDMAAADDLPFLQQCATTQSVGNR